MREDRKCWGDIGGGSLEEGVHLGKSITQQRLVTERPVGPNSSLHIPVLIVPLLVNRNCAGLGFLLCRLVVTIPRCYDSTMLSFLQNFHFNVPTFLCPGSSTILFICHYLYHCVL